MPGRRPRDAAGAGAHPRRAPGPLRPDGRAGAGLPRPSTGRRPPSPRARPSACACSPWPWASCAGCWWCWTSPRRGCIPRRWRRLLKVLRRLRDQGQTVVVVEHDATLARAADWLIDLGPGPGRRGRRAALERPARRPAGSGPATRPPRRWLAGAGPAGPPARPAPGTGSAAPGGPAPAQPPGPHARPGAAAPSTSSPGVSGARQDLPPGGGGGAPPGARSLPAHRDRGRRAHRPHAALQRRHLHRRLRPHPGPLRRLRRRPRPWAWARGISPSTPPAAAARPARAPGCSRWACATSAAWSSSARSAAGRRFHPEVLAVPFRGRSIADVLEGSIQEAAELFADQPKLSRILGALLDCGLGYLPLGQPATTLSGGEAQRVKLATELARAGSGGGPHRPGRAHHRAARGGRGGAAGGLGPPARRPGTPCWWWTTTWTVVRAADQRPDLGPAAGPRWWSPLRTPACARSGADEPSA